MGQALGHAKEHGTSGVFPVKIVQVAVVVALLTAGLPPAWATDPPAACDLTDSPPTVTTAYNKATYDAFAAAETANNLPHDAAAALKAASVIALGDVVTVTGENFAKFFDKTCASKSVVLFLNGLPMTGITPRPPSDPKTKALNFTLTRANATLSTWLPILSRPAGARPVTVSVGFSDGFAMGATGGALPVLNFSIVPTIRLIIWTVIFLVLAALFLGLAKRTNIIRDPSPATAGARGTYSLSRTQAAWWFFIILAAFLFIGIVTQDFSDSFNGTALTLLGIGAGTLIGSATIDAQKDTPRSKVETANAITAVQTEMAAPGSDHDMLASQLKKLKGQSENFITDILSDANGVSFHRFQSFAWTLVLSIIFAVDVYNEIAMPTFNATLLGMMGVSAGTYLGLKIPEPITPTKS